MIILPEHHHAIVTGWSADIGKATTKALADSIARVTRAGLNLHSPKQTAEEIAADLLVLRRNESVELPVNCAGNAQTVGATRRGRFVTSEEVESAVTRSFAPGPVVGMSVAVVGGELM